MEYALHEEFHSYAGGLGVLAGDFMKSAGDLGLPVVGIGPGGDGQRVRADPMPDAVLLPRLPPAVRGIQGDLTRAP